MSGRRRPTAAAARTLIAALALVAMLIVAALATDFIPLATGPLALLATATVVALALLNLRWAGAFAFAPSSLYGAALALFHLGMVVPVTLGVSEPPLWLASAPDTLVATGLLLVLLAFCCLETGLLLGWRRHVPAPSAKLGDSRLREMSSAASLVPSRAPRRRPSALHSGGMVIAVFAAIAAIVNAWSIGIDRFLSASYGYELYAATDSRLLQTGLYWLLPAAALIALAGARRGVETVRAGTLTLCVTLVLLWVGDRGGAFSLAAAALVVWTALRGPLPRGVALAAPIAALLLIPTIATIRQLPRNTVDLASLRTAAGLASPLAALAEMGATFRPLVETLDLVPAREPYRFGRSYVAATMRVVPNIGLSRSGGTWRDTIELPPGQWVTYTVAPWTYAAFGGLGFSAIAEPYLNFGVMGVVVYFLGLGLALGRLDLALARAPARRTLALAAVIFMPLLLTVRNDFHNFVRPALWGVAVVTLIDRIHGVRRPAARTPVAPTSSPQRVARAPGRRAA